MTTIYIDVDGQPVPAEDVIWLHIAPCGCIAGVTSINRFEVFTDGEEAFYRDDPKAIRDKYRKQGFTFQAVSSEQYKATYADRFKQHCKHSPEWGVDPIPVPDGWVWMTTDGGIGRRTFRKHLVQPTTQDTDRWNEGPALCGKQARNWNRRDHLLYDTVECSKCEKRARDTSPVLVPVGPVADVQVAGELL